MELSMSMFARAEDYWEARAKQAEQRRQWQPIETAPKDGTAILGYSDSDEQQTTVKWTTSKAYPSGWWELCVPGKWPEEADWSPTYWMPLETAPNAK